MDAILTWTMTAILDAPQATFTIDGPKTPNREQFVDLLVGKGADKRAIKGKYPEKARDYPAREETPSSERRERTSSLSRKLRF
jgi:hypothetical protein